MRGHLQALHLSLALRRLIIAIGICLFVLSGCGTQPTTTTTVSLVPAPPGDAIRVAWIDNWLVAEIIPPSANIVSDRYLWQFHLDGSNAARVPIPADPACVAQFFDAPMRVRGGRLGYIDTCRRDPTSAAFERIMMAFDVHTGRHERLVRAPLPHGNWFGGWYSWNPDMTRGIANDGNGLSLNHQLYWTSRDHTQPLDIGLPQVFAPVWAPDGSQIAFVGAGAGDLAGLGGLDTVYNIYLMNADGTHVHPLVTGLQHPYGMDWSPDGYWLIVPGRIGTLFPTEGLWLINVATGERQVLIHGTFSSPVWSSDGKRIAVIGTMKEATSTQEGIVILETGPWQQAP